MQRLGPGVELRAGALASLGVFVSSAFVTMIPPALWMRRQTHPQSWSTSLGGEKVSFVLALLILGFAFRAWRRTRRLGTRAPGVALWVDRAVPWLSLLGGATGVVLAVKISQADRENFRSLAASTCIEAIAGASIESAGGRAACNAAAMACIDQQDAIDNRSGQRPYVVDRRQSPTEGCVRERLQIHF